MELTTSVPSIFEERFIGTQIFILDDNIDKITMLIELIKEYEEAHFKYH